MNRSIHKIGYRAGLVAFWATVTFYIVQMLQIWGMLLFPWDEILIYGFSLCITLPFLMEMLALHYAVPSDKKFWSHGALTCTVVYVVFVTANYVVQLATVIPMTLQGSGDEIQLLRQTPHSMFWDYDAIGYIFMGLAAFIAIPVFEKNGFQRWVRYSFIAHVWTTPLIAFVYFYPDFSNELLLLATPWAITAPLFMVMLALWFKKQMGDEVLS
ncbi:hypothetical protein G3570_12150 [Balneolaceae bacterium YR4-1]|uniref:Uncharacterized protein n=1 Tax=Halalkalibaculum roseum TaxID=2709311 RepID=A0A6M1SPU8_9BACT|nr:hypothetical protein [Halalkalibaculum roseum]NGP77391.1 hypothetical protein [Halalkalibaculum roseum]